MQIGNCSLWYIAFCRHYIKGKLQSNKYQSSLEEIEESGYHAVGIAGVTFQELNISAAEQSTAEAGPDQSNDHYDTGPIVLISVTKAEEP